MISPCPQIIPSLLLESQGTADLASGRFTGKKINWCCEWDRRGRLYLSTGCSVLRATAGFPRVGQRSHTPWDRHILAQMWWTRWASEVPRAQNLRRCWLLCAVAIAFGSAPWVVTCLLIPHPNPACQALWKSSSPNWSLSPSPPPLRCPLSSAQNPPGSRMYLCCEVALLSSLACSSICHRFQERCRAVPWALNLESGGIRVISHPLAVTHPWFSPPDTVPWCHTHSAGHPEPWSGSSSRSLLCKWQSSVHMSTIS